MEKFKYLNVTKHEDVKKAPVEGGRTEWMYVLVRKQLWMKFFLFSDLKYDDIYSDQCCAIIIFSLIHFKCTDDDDCSQQSLEG